MKCKWDRTCCTAPDTLCPHWIGTFCELDVSDEIDNELPKEFIPRQKNFGSKQYVCPICLSLLDEVTDKVCPSCGEEMAWDKIKDGERK